MDSSNRPYWNMDVEPKLNTPEMRTLQFDKLKLALAWQYDHTPFNRKRFEKAGIIPDEIRSFDDFAAAIPVAGQAEIREIITEVGFDMDKLMIELFGEERFKDLYLLTTTSGTTGIPTPYPNFNASIADAQEIMSRAAWRMGVRPGDRIGLCFGLCMHAAGTPQVLWYKNFPGIMMVPIGAEAGAPVLL